MFLSFYGDCVRLSVHRFHLRKGWASFLKNGNMLLGFHSGPILNFIYSLKSLFPRSPPLPTHCILTFFFVSMFHGSWVNSNVIHFIVVAVDVKFYIVMTSKFRYIVFRMELRRL